MSGLPSAPQLVPVLRSHLSVRFWCLSGQARDQRRNLGGNLAYRRPIRNQVPLGHRSDPEVVGFAPVVVNKWEWGALPPTSHRLFRTWSSQNVANAAGFLPHTALCAAWCPSSGADEQAKKHSRPLKVVVQCYMKFSNSHHLWVLQRVLQSSSEHCPIACAWVYRDGKPFLKQQSRGSDCVILVVTAWHSFAPVLPSSVGQSFK